MNDFRQSFIESSYREGFEQAMLKSAGLEKQAILPLALLAGLAFSGMSAADIARRVPSLARNVAAGRGKESLKDLGSIGLNALLMASMGAGGVFKGGRILGKALMGGKGLTAGQRLARTGKTLGSMGTIARSNRLAGRAAKYTGKLDKLYSKLPGGTGPLGPRQSNRAWNLQSKAMKNQVDINKMKATHGYRPFKPRELTRNQKIIGAASMGTFFVPGMPWEGSTMPAPTRYPQPRFNPTTMSASPSDYFRSSGFKSLSRNLKPYQRRPLV